LLLYSCCWCVNRRTVRWAFLEFEAFGCFNYSS